MSKMIKVEVAYARPEEQRIVEVEVLAGSTIAMVIEASGILQLFPEINIGKQAVGIFSKSRQLSDLVNEGDRVEIYRPLTIDPMEARRAKAKKGDKK